MGGQANKQPSILSRIILTLFILLLFISAVSAQRNNNNRRGKGKKKNRGGNGGLPPVTLPPFLTPPVTGLTCEQRSSCTSGEDRTLYESNCFCDNLCDLYDDCCEDYMHPPEKPTKLKINKKMVDCVRNGMIDRFAEIYIIHKCPKDYGDAYVKEQCEMELDLGMVETDMFLSLPVSGIESKLLYKNYYCALCAGEREDEVSFWHVRVNCGGVPQGVNASNGVDVIEKALLDSETSRCMREYFHPEHKARNCKSNHAQCEKTWQGGKKVKKKCKGPTSYVYVDLQVFRNRYCAECLRVNKTWLKCVDTRTPKVGVGENSSVVLAPPFSILLDVNTGYGSIKKKQVGVAGVEEKTEEVVEVRQCPADHIYDPFVLSCRRVRCMPGMEFREGTCVPMDGYVPPSTTPPPPAVETDPAEEIINHTPAPDIDFIPPNVDLDDEDEEHNEYDLPEPYSTPEFEEGEGFNEDGPRAEFAEPDEIPTDKQSPTENIGPPLWDGQAHTLNCPLIEFNRSEFFILANNSAYVGAMNKAIPETQYIIFADNLLVCAPDHWEQNYTYIGNVTTKVIMFKFDRFQSLVSFVGILVSLTALLIHFIVYMMLPPLRNLPGKCIISLVVALWVAQALFLASAHLTDLPLPCLIISAAMHYAFLAAFFWMNVMAIDICRTFTSQNVGSQASPRSQGCRFAGYSLYAWITPGIIVGGSLALDMLDMDMLEPYRPYYGDGLCWITQRMALLILFAVPLATLLLINIILYIVTVFKMCRITQQTKAVHQKDKDKTRFLLYVKLSFIMGLTWVFGYLAALTELWYMWYVFIAFNTLQGAFICFAFVCTKKVFRLLKERGKVHRTSDGRYYSNSTSGFRSGFTRHTYLYDGEAKIISQETSI